MSINRDHVCSRDSCPPLNVSGNTVSCYLCKSKFFARCFGIDDLIFDAIAPQTIFSSGSSIQFVCPKCLKSPNKTTASIPDALATDIKEIQTKLRKVISNQVSYDRKLSSIAKESDQVRDKLGELFTINVSTNEACQKIDLNLKAVEQKMIPSFSEVVRGNTISPPNRPQPTKRPRIDRSSGSSPVSKQSNSIIQSNSTAQSKPKNRPAAMVGTSNANIGIPIVTIQTVPKLIGTKFNKSIWASRFHPDTTVDQVNELLMQMAKFDDKSQFYCKKLVKRDADLSLLHFVSFKIDLNEEHFMELMNPDVWPMDVHIREFSVEARSGPKQLSSNIAELPPQIDSSDSGDAMDTDDSTSNGNPTASTSLTQSSTSDPNLNPESTSSNAN